MMLLITGTVFCGCLSLALIAKEFWHADRAAVRRRIADEFGAEKTSVVNTSLLFKGLQRSLPDHAKEKQAPAASWRERFQEYVDDARLPFAFSRLFSVSLACGGVAAALVTWFRGPILGAAALLVGGIAPLLYVQWRRKARRENYLRQLPNVFDLMARVLRSGQSVQQALHAVAETCEDPVAEEFARCQKRLQYGMPNHIAYQELARRSGIVEMRLFVLAMVIQGQVGGNLAEVLERLSNTVRLRLRLRSQMRTLTAEGRMQGGVLVVLPFLLFGALMILNRSYIEVLLQHGGLIAIALGAMAVGVLWIRKIVRLDV